MTDKEKKAEYDRKRRLLKKDEIALKKKLYTESPAGRAMQKRQREKRKDYHNEYCRKLDQREKEKIRRHKREGIFDQTKFCLVCENIKSILDFSNSTFYHDKRYHLCKDCESIHKKELGVSTRGTIQTIVKRSEYRLSRKDVAEHPYLIEANKYLIALKKLV